MDRNSLPYRLRGWLMLLAVLLLGGCASAGMGGSGEGSVTLRVDNNLIPPTSLSIYARPDVGSEQLVGVVRPSETATLTFNPSVGGRYVFVAEVSATNEIVSTPVTVAPGDTVEWDLSSNIATVVSSG